MKRNISELMDHMPAEDIRMPAEAPLSSKRIKELTMEKLKKNAPRRRIGFKILVAAAIMAMLTVSVFAAEHVLTYDNWLEEYFSGKEVIADISREQLALLDQSVKRMDQSVTKGEYTVTLESVITDGYVAYLTFRLDGAPGTALEEAYYYFQGWPMELLGEDLEDGRINGAGAGWRNPEDPQPGDNSVRMLLEISTGNPRGWTESMTDGEEKTITLGPLMRDAGPEYEPEVLVEDSWQFSFSFGSTNVLTDEVEMLTSPVYTTARRCLGQHRFGVTLKVTSFRLRALTASCTMDAPLTGFWEGVLLDEIVIVMKDGSRIPARFSSGTYVEGEMEFFFEFGAPIAFAQVDYVEFAGGDRAYMPDGQTGA